MLRSFFNQIKSGENKEEELQSIYFRLNGPLKKIVRMDRNFPGPKALLKSLADALSAFGAALPARGAALPALGKQGGNKNVQKKEYESTKEDKRNLRKKYKEKIQYWSKYLFHR